MPFKLVRYRKDEQVLIFPLSCKYVAVPVITPYKNATLHPSKVLSSKVAEFFSSHNIKAAPIYINDYYYWLYSDEILDNLYDAIAKYAPMYKHPTTIMPDGKEYWEASDCDNKSWEWLRAMYHWALPGQAMLSFVGHNENNLTHYYCYSISSSFNFRPLNGCIKNNKVKQATRIEL